MPLPPVAGVLLPGFKGLPGARYHTARLALVVPVLMLPCFQEASVFFVEQPYGTCCVLLLVKATINTGQTWTPGGQSLPGC